MSKLPSRRQQLKKADGDKMLCLSDFFYYANCSQIPSILPSHLLILLWLKLMISRELQCSLLPLPPNCRARRNSRRQ